LSDWEIPVPDRLRFTATSRFEAARSVAVLPDGHRCRRLHGHGFLARVAADLPPAWAPFAGAEVETLSACLDRAVADADYRFLNELLAVPTDEELARWVRRRLERQSVAQRSVPGITAVGVQSTPDQGADLDGDGSVHVWRRFRFEAAHQLPNVPAGHQCGRMHGHGFEVVLHAQQPLAEGDHLGIDYDLLAERWAPFVHQLDHRCLNDISGLSNPTSEVLAAWVWARLKPQLPELSWVSVYETSTAGCHFDGVHHRIWKEFRFEGALRLVAAPELHPARRLHGHSYRMRLHLTAPLDAVLGWTVDYGDVKALFRPVYAMLDHHQLDGLEGLGRADAAGLLQWMRERTITGLPQLDRIDLEERPGCGAQLSWGAEPPALPAG
jgi:6-pyruvoyltetrahydropterin/6-carboxytetrahydropterin synthase